MESTKNIIPGFAKDTRLNLSTLLGQDGASGLTSTQALGVALTSAYSTRSKTLIESVLDDVRQTLEDKQVDAARTAATLMAMTNVYYRSVHFANDRELSKMPAKLRMNGLRNHDIEQKDFELFSLAASAINGCEQCTKAHVNSAIKEGISFEGIQSVFRIAAVLQAAAQALAIPH